MGVQHLKPRQDAPIVIETPEGLIRIFQESKKTLRIECPGAMKAHIGEDRALRDGRFVSKHNGSLRPTFGVLKPVLDKNGNLVGIEARELFVVDGEGPSDVRLVGRQ